jgi:hypothetical protein
MIINVHEDLEDNSTAIQLQPESYAETCQLKALNTDAKDLGITPEVALNFSALVLKLDVLEEGTPDEAACLRVNRCVDDTGAFVGYQFVVHRNSITYYDLRFNYFVDASDFFKGSDSDSIRLLKFEELMRLPI